MGKNILGKLLRELLFPQTKSWVQNWFLFTLILWALLFILHGCACALIILAFLSQSIDCVFGLD